MAAMEIRPLFYGLILVGIFHLTLPRSLDQKIQDAGEQFVQSKFVLGDGPVSIPLTTEQKWYDYKVRGRDEKLVKLQLDMIMTKEQWQTVIDTEDAPPSRIRRNAVKDKVRLWPRRIPYILNDAFNISDKFKLVMAMKHWEEHTCLEFVEADDTDADVIEFVSNEKLVCESALGRIQGRQSLNLGPGCMDKEIIVHEIGHALGLYHEHMRADRDDYVTVNYENMNNDSETHRQFDKLKAEHYNDYNKLYDYESIMHYGKLFYSKDSSADLITLETKNETFLNVIGNALSLSFYDVRIVSDMYKCSEGCMPRSCPGDGFLGKNCECYCKGKDSYDIVLCDKPKDCGIPNITLSDYLVYTKYDEGDFITFWNEGVAYPHGTQYIVEHKNTGCGLAKTTINCTDGQWDGGPPPCEKACYVDDFSDDYIVKNSSDEIVNKGHEVVSQDGIYVMCRNRRVDDEDEYIECSDGVWNKQISDISCNKERPFCSMVINAKCSGSFETGFSVTCLDGYEMKGDPVNSFQCSWQGTWEPYRPICNPAKCLIPQSNDRGELFNQIGEELFRGSFASHGSDVTLTCPPGHVPDENTFSCQFGKWGTPDGEVPQCEEVFCQQPRVVDARWYRPGQENYMYGDKVTVGLCNGVLALEGSRELTCLSNGEWSDDAVCKPFCERGRVEFEEIKHRTFKNYVRKLSFGLSSYKACERKCEKFNRILCLSFVYGFENGNRFCRIYVVRPENKYTEEKPFWTIGERKCV